MRSPLPWVMLFAVLLLATSMGSGIGLGTSASYPPLKGTVNGPTLFAVGGKAIVTVTASGGPAELANGTVKGNYTYNATISGGNTTGSSVSPATGSLVNETARLMVTAPSSTGTFTLTVELKSASPKGNSTYTNVSYNFDVVTPYVVTATLDNPTPYKVTGAVLQVNLDGSTVSEVTLPAIGANGTYSFVYNYTTKSMSPGYHTFTLSIHSTPGLLVFSDGSSQISTTFYVTPAPPDYTLYILTGLSLTVLAIFISLLVVGGRARRRSK